MTSWESRNRGFIPPSELRAQSQSPPRDFTSSPPPPQTRPASVATSSPLARPGPAPTTASSNSHNRASSFFSFRTKSSGPPSYSSPPPSKKLSRANSPGTLRKQQQSTLPQLNPPERDSPPPQNQTQIQAPVRTAVAEPEAPPLHPEIRSIVALTMAHTQKIYFSGPLVRRLERQSDGQKPGHDTGWRDVWVQLYGTTLSIWDMKEVKEASEQGREVPPSYVNVTEAFIQVLGAVTQPATENSPAQKHSNVITLNTAGTNLILFSCPTTADCISWAAALRLATWEKSRLEEMYTAHLIRITLNDGRSTPTPLVNGRMEGWVRVRIAGQTDWKKFWLVLNSGSQPSSASAKSNELTSISSRDGRGAPKKKRMSTLFSRDRSPDQPEKPMMSLYASPKSKDKKVPALSFGVITQAFSVYPERPKLISSSTLVKLEGTYGQEELAGPMKYREGWMLMMPDLEGARNPGGEMLKWLLGIHDAFELYGRPKEYSWDPRNQISMMFAYPIGQNKDLLFLDREYAEAMDPREDRTPLIRSNLLNIIAQRMRGVPVPTGPQAPGQLPPATNINGIDARQAGPPQGGRQGLSSNSLPQLPPLSFDGPAPAPPQQDQTPPTTERRTLTPITERSVQDSGSWDQGVVRKLSVATMHPVSENKEQNSFLDQPISDSPQPDLEYNNSRKSFDSGRMGAGSRPDSKLDHSFVHPRSQESSSVKSVDPVNMTLPVSPNTEGYGNSPPPRMAASRTNSRFSVLSSQSQQSGGTPQPETPRFSRAESPAQSFNNASHDLKSPTESVLPNPFTPASKVSTLPDPYTPLKARNGFHDAESPSSPMGPSLARPASPPLPAPPPPPESAKHPERTSSRVADDGGISGALYYMQQDHPNTAPIKTRKAPVPESESESDESDYSPEAHAAPQTLAAPPPPPAQIQSQGPPTPLKPILQNPASPPQQYQPESQLHLHQPPPTPLKPILQNPSIPLSEPTPLQPQKKMHTSFTPVSISGTKPSGARDRVNRQGLDPHLLASRQNHNSANTQQMAQQDQGLAYDDNSDALAALNFLEADESSSTVQQKKAPENLPAAVPPPPPVHVSPPEGDYDEVSEGSGVDAQYKSTFAPSRKAAERIAKTQAQQAAHQAAVHKPGRSNGKPNSKGRGAWGDSSDEEEEDEGEEEEDDDDVDSDGERAPASRGAGPDGNQASPYGSSTDHGANNQRIPPRHLPQLPPGQQGYGQQQMQQGYGQQQIPQGYGQPQMMQGYGQPQQGYGGPNEGYNRDNSPQRGSNQYAPEPPRPQYFDEGPRRGSPQPPAQQRYQLEHPNPTPHQSIWTTVLEPGRGTSEKERDTFVQIEPPSQTMTKAFAPHGLLSAGLQDKDARSAKRQEEFAKETGASLVNVPNKPPPPQTGLLGAVSAHERERKREGGIGAALTERERERRLAEERQRKLDDFQRQQLEMAQTGSMYGGQFGGYNPMMANPMMMGMNPMMMGMNPMMGGGFPPMNPMMGGFGGNPQQQMFAAQQAAQQAYQQAMMAYSQAGGSQMGDMGGMQPQNSGMQTPGMQGQGMQGMQGQGMQGLNPMMTGGSMYDPRMTMMGMPMMGMGMGMGMNGMGMGGMSPQMTGQSAFDPRFSGSPSQFDLGGPPRMSASPHDSPTGPRPVDALDPPTRGSANASPNMQHRS